MADPVQEIAALAVLARRTLLDEVLPHVPDGQRYQTLMVANALGIAARELASGAQDRAALAQAMARLAGDGDGDGDAATVRRRLAAAIRSGALDDEPALVPLLRREVKAALAVANPKYLKRT